MVKLYEVMQAVRSDLEKLEVINKTKWDFICAEKVTSDRCQSSYLWKVLVEGGIFKPINGKAWQVNHDRMSEMIIRNNPGNGGA